MYIHQQHPPERTFLLSESPEKLFAGASTPALQLSSGSEYRSSVSYFDTFDWRLYRSGWCLKKSGRSWYLIDIVTRQVLQTSKLSKTPRFARDFPVCQLREMIMPVCDIRALLKKVHVGSTGRRIGVLDEREKILARMTHEQLQVKSEHGTRAVQLLVVKGLRGYGDAFELLEKRLFTSGQKSIGDHYFSSLMEVAGLQPGGYSSKTTLSLDPQQSAESAARVILQRLMEIMRVNEAGVLGDLDTEFLHDFRVAIRRTRSALSQIRGVFPESQKEYFKTRFANLQRTTNLLRDLDVYLLDADSYRAMLPPALNADIEPLFLHLEKERKKALRQVVRTLKHEDYQQLLGEWEAFLGQPISPVNAANADRPISILAKKIIFKRYRKVIRNGSAITPDSADELLHELRIDCKKLRYLLEFFESLFPKEQISALVKQLKRLQDNLGRFNDCSVQVATLLERLGRLGGQSEDLRTAAAIGCLCGTILEQKRRVRRAFRASFRHFANKEVQHRVRTLFR